ncbi:MAG: inositol monophosphatase family protein [Acidimicrobiales bacterium]
MTSHRSGSYVELLDLADRAAEAVVPELSTAISRDDLVVETKSTGTDMVTDMDRWSESTIISVIRGERPHDGFVGEEGTDAPTRSEVTWLIDPIDGTTNYVYELPGCAVSIAARIDGHTVAAVVHDIVRGERFRAALGQGATLDGRRLRPGPITDLALALVATGFSYDPERRRRQARVLVEILPRVRDIRRFGGAAIDLCSVAAGRVDAYYERGLSPWDSAAGELIVVEAGAMLSAPVAGGAIIASAPPIHDAFAALVAEAGAHDA